MLVTSFIFLVTSPSPLAASFSLPPKRKTIPPNPSSPSSYTSSRLSNSSEESSIIAMELDEDASWTPAMLAESLNSPSFLLLLDVQSSYTSFSENGHIQTSLYAGNIPTALLKRPAFPLDKMLGTFVKDLASHPSLMLGLSPLSSTATSDSKIHILVYDESSESIKPSSLLDLFFARLNRDERVCPHWLLGGFDAFSKEFPSLCNFASPSPAKDSNVSMDRVYDKGTETPPSLCNFTSSPVKDSNVSMRYEKGTETPPECLPFE
jgi:hypothetical protein